MPPAPKVPLLAAHLLVLLVGERLVTKVLHILRWSLNLISAVFSPDCALVHPSPRLGNLSLLTLITLVCCVELSPVLLLLLLWIPELDRESIEGFSNTGCHCEGLPAAPYWPLLVF